MPLARRKRFLFVTVLVVLGTVAAVRAGNEGLRSLEDRAPSRSIGTPSNGALEDGKRLPTAGRNFVAYSRLGALLGRNSVHSAVRDTVLEAYELLEQRAPRWHFTYGETGWPRGGRFRPHRSHQNGMSVDFMMPLWSARSGAPVRYPASPFNKFGYGLEFDRAGALDAYRIDFEIVARHLAALDEAAKRHGLVITKVILAPEYLPLLWKTDTGKALQKKLPFMDKPAWVRHDEHYHVDFGPRA
jgi:penicillin-insensitive murein endopeptidase